MRHTRLFQWVLLSGSILFAASAARADPVKKAYPYGWDVNKYWEGNIPAGVDPDDTTDNMMCWAASAANVLAFTGWIYDRDHDGFHEAYDDAYHEFLHHYPNQPGNVGTAFTYYVDKFYPQFDPWDYRHFEFDDDEILQRMDQWLNLDYGMSLGITTGPAVGHAITAWGIEYDPDEPDYYTRIGVTDSDDGVLAFRWYDLEFKNNRWYMSDYYAGDWYIRSLYGFEQNPIPEPATLLMVGLALFALRRRR